LVDAHSSKSKIRHYADGKVYYQPTREDKSLYRIWYIEVYERSGFGFDWATRNEEEIGPVYATVTSTPPLPIGFEFSELNKFQLFWISMKRRFVLLLAFASMTSTIFFVMLYRNLRTYKAPSIT